jgi:hypothetical protein
MGKTCIGVKWKFLDTPVPFLWSSDWILWKTLVSQPHSPAEKRPQNNMDTQKTAWPSMAVSPD